jgi:hypothetical protein
MRDDEERPGGAWTDLVIPDDIRELAPEIAAYHRELRQARRSRLTRVFQGRRSGTPMLALIAASLLAGLIALMLTVMAPRAVETPPASAPLATTTVADGQLHGLLPGVVLTGPNGKVDSLAPALRPAVFALVPQGCSCHALLDGIAGAAFSERLQLAVVVAATSDPGTAAVVDSLDRGLTSLYLDPQGKLALAINGAIPAPGGQTATVVVVNRDGTIYDIERNVANAGATSLDATLQTMLLAH